jgi:hypothetical protein
MHDEVEFKYYDGGIDWVKVSNDEELATMFAKHKEKEQFHVRLQNDVVVPAVGPSRTDSCRRNGSSSQNSSVRGASVSARRRGGSSNMGTGSRVPREVGLNTLMMKRGYILMLCRIYDGHVGLKTEMSVTMRLL